MADSKTWQPARWLPFRKLWTGQSLNVGELQRQTALRRLFRFRFYGVIVGRWQIGAAQWQQEKALPSPPQAQE